MRLGPVGFLLVAALGWVTMRGFMLWPEQAVEGTRPCIVWSAPIGKAFGQNAVERPATDVFNGRKRLLPSHPHRRGPSFLSSSFAATTKDRSWIPALARMTKKEGGPAKSVPTPARFTHPSRRVSLSAWALLRERGSATGLAAAGQLGGSQAGVRLRFEVTERLSLSGRLSAPLRTHLGREAALGVDLRPFTAAPIVFMIERRIGLDRGGRNAFALGVAGGVDSVRLPLGLRLDGYGQAGVVGARSRDFYTDGALRIERTVATSGSMRFGIGAGVWGGAQPGVARLDVGPQLVAHIPAANGGIRISAEWRQRVVGDALPGSGPALSLGADF